MSCLPTDYSTACRLGADRRISIYGIKRCDGRAVGVGWLVEPKARNSLLSTNYLIILRTVYLYMVQQKQNNPLQNRKLKINFSYFRDIFGIYQRMFLPDYLLSFSCIKSYDCSNHFLRLTLLNYESILTKQRSWYLERLVSQNGSESTRRASDLQSAQCGWNILHINEM